MSPQENPRTRRGEFAFRDKDVLWLVNARSESALLAEGAVANPCAAGAVGTERRVADPVHI